MNVQCTHVYNYNEASRQLILPGKASLGSDPICTDWSPLTNMLFLLGERDRMFSKIP